MPENKNSQVAPEGEVRASDAVKISTAFKNMAEKIKVPVRYGKIKGTSNVLGQYYPDKEMIRVRYANDIETLSHEVGHHLEKIMFGDIGAEQTKSFQSELEKIATKTNMRDKERGNRAEGFAEFISWFVANPQKAKELCPKFYEYFDDRMKFEMPEQYDLLMETRDTITKYVEQPDVMKVLSKISVGEKEQKAPIDLKEKLIQNFYDDIYPLKKITEDLGIDPFSHQSPYLQARMLRGGIEAKASYGLKEDQISYDGQVVGPSLAKILEPVKGSLLSKGKLNKDTLRAYMVSRRALEKEVQGIKTGIDIKAAMNTVKEYNDQYKDIANALAEFAKNDLKLLVDSGLLSKESYNNITAKNEFYVPMNRVMDIDIEGGIGGKRLKPSNPSKK